MKSWRSNNPLNFGSLEQSEFSPVYPEIFSNEPEELPADIKSWKEKLSLLYGVPFSNLIAHPELLPMESIRFFQIDNNWIFSLIEGALSLGRISTPDKAHDLYYRPLIHQQEPSLKKTTQKSTPLKEPEKAEGDEEIVPVTGFLLRSVLIEGWPGLEVTAYSKENKQLPRLRLDKLSSNVLIGLFKGEICKITFQEPPETLHFGVDYSARNATPFFKELKHIRPQGRKNPGDSIDGASAPAVPFREENSRVIDVTRLATDLRQSLIKAQAWDEISPFTSAEFSLQMVEGTQKISLNLLSSEEL